MKILKSFEINGHGLALVETSSEFIVVESVNDQMYQSKPMDNLASASMMFDIRLNGIQSMDNEYTAKQSQIKMNNTTASTILALLH